MEKTHVTLHIFTSVDGKITGSFSKAKEAKIAGELFESIGFKEDHPDSFHFDGWIYGSTTSKEFTGSALLDLEEPTQPIPAGDFIINQGKEKYFIAFDRKGSLAWQTNKTSYANQEAYVIEVLTEMASDSYKNFLRKQQIPYLIAGKEQINIPLVFEKLATIYDASNLLLGGGGVLNWSFLDAGLVDEISLIVAPAVDGNPNDTDLFDASFSDNSRPIGFSLNAAQVLEGNTLWLRYQQSDREKK